MKNVLQYQKGIVALYPKLKYMKDNICNTCHSEISDRGHCSCAIMGFNDNRNNEIIAAAFQSWENGGSQTSGFYTNEEAITFIDDHFKSNTFATLHTFYSVSEGICEYAKMNGFRLFSSEGNEYLYWVDINDCKVGGYFANVPDWYYLASNEIKPFVL